MGKDWEKFVQDFAKNFPEETAKKKCSDCIYSTWAKVNTVDNEQTFTPYCSELNIVLRTLVEAENCDSYTFRNKE